MVTDVKLDREVGLEYMKSWELETRILSETNLEVLDSWLRLAKNSGDDRKFCGRDRQAAFYRRDGWRQRSIMR